MLLNALKGAKHADKFNKFPALRQRNVVVTTSEMCFNRSHTMSFLHTFEVKQEQKRKQNMKNEIIFYFDQISIFVFMA